MKMWSHIECSDKLFVYELEKLIVTKGLVGKVTQLLTEFRIDYSMNSIPCVGEGDYKKQIRDSVIYSIVLSISGDNTPSLW